MQSKHFIRAMALLMFTTLVTACAEGINWSEREIRNGENILASLQAVSEAAQIANRAATASELAAAREQLLGKLRRAHLLASSVDTIVLEKLHPRMYSQFRLRYQRALGRMVKAYEQGDIDAAERAAADVQDFMAWFRKNRHVFRWWDESLE